MPKKNTILDLKMVDKNLVLMIFILLLVGVVMVYSAKLPLPSNATEHVFWYQIGTHSLHVIIGLLALLLFLFIPTDFLEKTSGVLFGLGIFLLFIVVLRKVSGGDEVVVDGAVRSIPVGLMSFQPSELMKLFVLIFVSAYAVRRRDRIHDALLQGILPIGLLMAVIVTFLLYQPDLGSTMVITFSAVIILFLGGMSLKILAFVTGFLVTFSLFIIYITPWRLKRLLSYWDPCAIEHSQNAGYQLCNALVAFGNGGILGTGLGVGQAKLGHLPLPHTDFIFSVIGEELGFFGISFILLTFCYFLYKSIEIGRSAMANENLFSGLLAQGIGVLIAMQALIHAGVNTGLLPTKGLTLPFISYGGSSMLVVCIAVGILLRIDIENKVKSFGFDNSFSIKRKWKTISL